jgi:hypothetical protein
MAVLIDPPAWPGHGRWWSHLVSDTSFVELHAFARSLGIPERAFEGDHYDIPQERYAALVDAGAVAVSSRDLLRRLVEAGLRRPKRKGERVLASHPVPGGPGRVDTVVSALRPRAPIGSLTLLAVVGGRFLAVRRALEPPTVAAPVPDPGWLARHWLGAAAGPPRQVGYLREVGTAAPGTGPGGRVALRPVELVVALQADEVTDAGAAADRCWVEPAVIARRRPSLAPLVRLALTAGG